MGRKYELKKRAERQEETRRRIVEAAVELHGTIGPARTTVSAVAERAGVQRHTYYRHFPDERSLGLACSGLYMETNPMPDPEPWREIDDLEPMLSNVIRDAELDPVFAEIGRMRIGPPLGAIRAVLANGRRSKRLLALLDVTLAFSTWRTLVRDSGLSHKEAVETMVAAIRCVRSV